MSAPHNQFWTPVEDARLRHLYEVEGKSASVIAEIMPGRTFHGVKCRIHLLGMKAVIPRNNAWPPERDELLRQLWCIEGLSAGKISKLMPGITPNAIIGRVHRLGMSGASRANSTRAQQHAKPPKPKVERRPSRPRNVIRFGGLSIPKSVIPSEAPEPERLTPTGVTLDDRRSDQCGWPVNDGNPYLYCGAAKSGHKRYCEHHACAATARGRRVA